MNEFIQGQLASNKENIQIIMNKVDESVNESLRNEIIAFVDKIKSIDERLSGLESVNETLQNDVKGIIDSVECINSVNERLSRLESIGNMLTDNVNSLLSQAVNSFIESPEGTSYPEG